MTGCERNRPKINVYYFRYTNRSLNAHLYSEKCLNTAKYKITHQCVARQSWLFAANMPPSPLFTKIKIHTLLILLFKFFFLLLLAASLVITMLSHTDFFRLSNSFLNQRNCKDTLLLLIQA